MVIMEVTLRSPQRRLEGQIRFSGHGRSRTQAADGERQARCRAPESSGRSLTADERARQYYQQAEALELRGHTEEALAAYQAAQAEAAENVVHWAQCERSIAWLLCRKGQLEAAAAACERARALLEEGAAGRVPTAGIDLADVLRTQGLVEILRGRHECGRAALQRALAIYECGEPCEGMARCYSYLAQLYHNQGDLLEMLAAAQHARTICEQVGNPVSVAHALNNVAFGLTLLHRHEEALPLLYRVVEIFERCHEVQHLPNVYHSLAAALLQCGRAEAARPYLEQGLEHARRQGEVRTAADFHRLLARQAVQESQTGEAREQFEAALRLCATAGLEPQHAAILIEYGQFLDQSDEPRESGLDTSSG
jgi:tetratricopeptide (TPR) repeat protein